MKPNALKSMWLLKAGSMLFVAIAAVQNTTGVDFNWNVAGPADWNVGSNWDPEGPPGGGGGNHAFVNNGGTAEISADIPDIQDIFVGSGADTSGTLNQIGGDTFQGTGSWMFVGQNGGVGVYNLHDGTQNKDRLFIGRNGGNGMLNLSGTGAVSNRFLVLGEGADATGVADVTGGTVHTTQEVWIGNAGGNGTLHQNAGRVEADTWIAIGRDSSTGVVSLSGNAVMRKVIVDDFDPGSISASEASFIVLGGLGSNGSGTLNVMDNAIVESGNGMILGEDSNNSGVVNQSGGKVTLHDWTPWVDPNQPSVGASLIIGNKQQDGDQNTGNNAYILSAGTLNAETIVLNAGRFNKSGGALTLADFQMSGGTLNADTLAGPLEQNGGTVSPAGSPGTMTITGNYSLNSGKLAIEIEGTNPGTGHDQLIVTGDVALAGTLEVALLSPFVLGSGMWFEILKVGGFRTGEFDGLDEGGFVGNFGKDLYITYLAGDGNDVALFTISEPEPEQVAYWRMEDGSVGEFVTPTAGRTTIEALGTPLSDATGNGNTAYTWDDNSTGHAYTDDVPPSPSSRVPATGEPNSLAIVNYGSWPATFTWSAQSSPTGIDVETISLLQWTIEASFKASTVDGTYRTFVGREGNNVATADPNLAPVYFQITGGDAANLIQILYVDQLGNVHAAKTSYPILAHQWYHVAAVNDGANLSLYVDQFDGTGYQLAATTDVSWSANPAMVDPGVDVNGDTWGWTLGRGRYGTGDNPNDNHTDRFFGVIDEVRISNRALAPEGFLFADANMNRGPTLQINRDTGTMTLLNYQTSVNLVGYTITSPSGALDPYYWLPISGNSDVVGDGSFDPDDHWFVVSNATTVLSEYEPIGDGGQLGTGGTQTELLLGPAGIWNANVHEDISMAIIVLDESFVEKTNSIPVVFVGTIIPNLSVDPTNLTPVCIEGSNAVSDQFEIWNSGGETLNYTISDDAGWLNCTPTSGSSTGEIDSITVNYSTAGLASGTYTGIVTVTPAVALNLPQRVEVTLTVGAIPGKPSTLMHRWSFNEISGANVEDSVGGADGTVIGTQFAWVGGALNLTNSGSYAQNSGAAETNTALSYVDLPNGVFSALSSAVTFELWYTYEGGVGDTWQRMFDVGIADTGVEGDVQTGSTNLFMTCESGADTIRWVLATNLPGYSHELMLGEIGDATSLAGIEQHIVLTYDSDDGLAYLYLNGVLVDIQTATWPMHDVPDVNNWIGRSQYESDPLLNGRINELRIYNGLLTPAEVQEHLTLGPDVITSPAPPTITQSPQSQSVAMGEDVWMSGHASGLWPLSFQWTFNGTNIVGATSDRLFLTNVQPADAGSYALVVTNVYGSDTSSPAVLTVSASQAVIARWNFNSPVPDGDLLTGTLTPYRGSGSAAYVGGTGPAGTNTFFDGSESDPAPSDNSSWLTTSYPKQGTANKTAGVRFTTSTVGWKDIAIEWNQYAFEGASKYWRLQYTLDGSWYWDVPTTSAMNTEHTDEHKVFSISGADNNPNFGFQIVAEWESTALDSPIPTNNYYVSIWSPPPPFEPKDTYNPDHPCLFDMVTVYGEPISPPHILTQPASLTVPQGQDATFSVTVESSYPVGFQWFFNGTNLPGATAREYTVANAQPADEGDYTVVVTNIAGSVTSTGATLTVLKQVETAGDLLVNVDATSFPEGPLTYIPNNGTMGGGFEATGGGTTVPTITPISGSGTPGIRFNGDDYLQHVQSLGGVLLPADAGLVGSDPTRSIEVWAFNPSIAVEETMVSIGKRGGPAGSNCSFDYGSHANFGAVVHWEAPDIGWVDTGGAPAAGQWHHLVYTYDGTTTRLYVDGALTNSEVLGAGVINTYAGLPIQLGAQLDPDGTNVTAGLRGTLTLGRVRIHDGVLSDTQVLNNYNAEADDFTGPSSMALVGGPIHRYSFSNPATADATGATIVDSVGSANGVVVNGSGIATFTGQRLTLSGGDLNIAPYVDLPNGLLSAQSSDNGGSGEITLEGWVRVTGNRGWSRIFDFGSTVGGELTGPGGTGEGLDYLFLSAQIGDDINARRVEVRNQDGASGGVNTADYGTFTFNTDLHFAVSWRESTGEIEVCENGLHVLTLITDERMSDINDINNWLGRSNWPDNNTEGEFDEFRIYDRVLAPAEVLRNYEAGPDIVAVGDVAWLTIANNGNGTITLSWPIWASDYFLESSAVLGTDALWDLVFDAPAQDGAYYRLTLPASQAGEYYRLSK